MNIKVEEYKSAKNIPMGQLLNEPDKYLNKRKEYYIMCQSGGRSARACNNLTNKVLMLLMFLVEWDHM